MENENLEQLIAEDRKSRGEAARQALTEISEKYKIELVPVVIIRGNKTEATIEMVVL